MGYGDVGNRPPYPIGVMIDAQDTDRYPGSSRRSAAFGIATQTVHPTVQRNEYAVCVDHADRTDVAVVYRIALQCLFIRILRCLLYRRRCLDIVSVRPVNIEDPHENPLPRSEITGRVHHTLVAELSERYINFQPEQIHKDACADDGYDARLGALSRIQNVIAVPVRAEVILFSLCLYL